MLASYDFKNRGEITLPRFNIRKIGGSMIRSIQNRIKKPSGLLLVLGFGLAIGLWMGFNSQAHKQVVHSWNGTRTYFAHMGNSIAASTHQWEVQLKTGDKSTPASKTASQPNTTITKWISNVFTNLGKFLHKTWQSIATDLHLKSA